MTDYVLKRMLSAIKDGLPLLAVCCKKPLWGAEALEQPAAKGMAWTCPSNWTRSLDGFGNSGVLSSVGIGEGQHAMRQHRPSFVPQQQAFSPWIVRAANMDWPITHGHKLAALKLSRRIAVMAKRKVEGKFRIPLYCITNGAIGRRIIGKTRKQNPSDCFMGECLVFAS